MLIDNKRPVPDLEAFADSDDLADALDQLANGRSGELTYYLKEAAIHIRGLYRDAVAIDEARKAAEIECDSLRGALRD